MDYNYFFSTEQAIFIHESDSFLDYEFCFNEIGEELIDERNDNSTNSETNDNSQIDFYESYSENGEKESFIEKKNQEESIIFENKPYSWDKENQALKLLNQENFDKIYKTIFNTQLKIDKIKPFNITTFKEKDKNRINIKVHPPNFINLREIINLKEEFLSPLWDDPDKSIFKDKEDLFKVVESNEFCKIYQDILNYLQGKKRNNHNKKRKEYIDEMILKIKNKILYSYLKATNSFNEFKMRPISTIKHELVNKPILADFNLILLEKPLCLILSNKSNDDTKNKNNKKIIQEALNGYNNGSKEKIIYSHLYLTFQNCLDIFRYVEKNENFNYKLVDFLFEEFKSQVKKMEKKNKEKKEENKAWIQQYIVSLLLLTYNYELFFYIRKMKSEKIKNKQNNNKILGRKIKFIVEK